MPGEVVPLSEGFVADRTLELIQLAPPPLLIRAGMVVLVMRPHVVHQVGGHPEGDVALGADVLRGKSKGRQRRRQQRRRYEARRQDRVRAENRRRDEVLPVQSDGADEVPAEKNGRLFHLFLIALEPRSLRRPKRKLFFRLRLLLLLRQLRDRLSLPVVRGRRADRIYRRRRPRLGQFRESDADFLEGAADGLVFVRLRRNGSAFLVRPRGFLLSLVVRRDQERDVEAPLLRDDRDSLIDVLLLALRPA